MPTNEAEERQRQRVLAIAQEDMRKEILASLTDIHLAAIGGGLGNAGSPNTMTMYRFAAFLSVLSRKADEQATKNLAVQNDMLRITRIVLWVSIIFGIASFLQLVVALLK